MELDKEPKSEETVVEPTTPVAESPKAPKTPVKKSFWTKLIPWVIVALVFFLGGLAVIYFTVFKAAKADIVNTNANIASLTSEVNDLKSKVDQEKAAAGLIQTELDGVKVELTAANTMIEEKIVELDKANQLKTVYKFLADVNHARAVLESLDVESARQAINFAKADLTDLQATDLTADDIAGFASRLEEADNKLNEPDLLSSRAALNTIYSNLLLLIDNLK